MMTRQTHNHNNHNQEQQNKVFYELSSLILNLMRYPPVSGEVRRQGRQRHAPLSEITPAGFASMMLGISLALMLCGSITFLLGFLLMPWVLGLVMLFYVAGIVSSLAMIGRAVLLFTLAPCIPSSPRKGAAVPAWKLL